MNFDLLASIEMTACAAVAIAVLAITLLKRASDAC
jgi:hypothetical protein